MKRHKLILVRDVRAPWFFLAKDVGVRGGGATMRSIKHIIIIIYIIVIIINNLNVFFHKKMLVFLLVVVRTYDPLSTAVSHTPGDQILSLLAGILANHPWVSHHCFHLNYHHRHHKKSLKAYRTRYTVQLNQKQNLSFIIAIIFAEKLSLGVSSKLRKN